MNVQIISQEFSLTASLRDRLERRLHFAFSHARSKIVRIVVRLRDLNGARGGRDKVCQVSVTIPGQPEVVIREVQEDMYYAIDSAVKRAAYRAIRLLTRKTRASKQPVTPQMAQRNRLPEESDHG